MCGGTASYWDNYVLQNTNHVRWITLMRGGSDYCGVKQMALCSAVVWRVQGSGWYLEEDSRDVGVGARSGGGVVHRRLGG